MAVTRLKRKARRNRTRARVKNETIQRLNAKPVIKSVDVEEVKKEFNKDSKPAKKKEEEKPDAKAEKKETADTKDTKKEEPKAKSAETKKKEDK